MKILGIDPGQSGAFVFLDNGIPVWSRLMPLTTNKDIDFKEVRRIIAAADRENCDHIILERAKPLAMGAKHAFNYGRGFAALELAIALDTIPVTYVEPEKWGKVIHEGISADLKPKAKSRIAFERLFKRHLGFVPKSKVTAKGGGKYHEGILEALLIAAYGERHL
jgi:hypothetical protein